MPPFPQGSGNNGNDERKITYFASTHTRGKREMFGIRAVDRGKHMYVIGKTGMGKSTMLENMAIQDIQNGNGIAFIDPHGSTAEKLLDFVPADRVKDVVYFAPFDTEYPIGFNVMEDVGFDKRHLVVSGLMGAFKRIWVDAWSARMEYILQNVLLALLEYPDSTLLDVNRMLTNKPFRAAVIEKITDPVVRSFWTEEFATYTDRYTQEATPAIQNKVGQFVANPLIRNIVGQPKSTFDLRKMMDEKKIFIVNLSKGRMGESNAALLGSMLTVKIYLAAMSRADEPAARMAALPRCYFYVDEFQSMMNEAFADILSESRKYKLALTLANQYIEQMEENVRNAVFGNVGTLITFRVGPFDAEVLTTVFEPTFEVEDLVNLGLGQIYLTLMIDGVGSVPFSADTIPPIEAPPISYREDVIQSSRKNFARTRAEMEAIVMKRQSDFAPVAKAPQASRDSRDSRGGSGYQGPQGNSGGNSGGQGNSSRSSYAQSGRSERDRSPAPSPQSTQAPANPPAPAPTPTPAPIPMQPRPGQTAAPRPVETNPRREEARSHSSNSARPQEVTQDSLKAAIASAKQSLDTGRSPLEVMRARYGSRGPRPPQTGSTSAPHISGEKREVPPAQSSPPAQDKEHSAERETKQRPQNREVPARPTKSDIEISTEELRKILNG